MGNKLFVGGLPGHFTQDDLGKLFAECGRVVSAKLIIDRETGRSKGFGFVELETAEQAQAALALNGRELGDKRLYVTIARPEPGGGPNPKDANRQVSSPSYTGPERRSGRDRRAPGGFGAKPERRSFGEKKFGERKPFGERKFGDKKFGDRKPFGERKFGDKPFGDRKPFGEKKFGDRKPFGERKFGDKKFGDRKPFGERKFGDKKFGDRKPFGDKKFGEQKPGFKPDFKKTWDRTPSKSGERPRWTAKPRKPRPPKP